MTEMEYMEEMTHMAHMATLPSLPSIPQRRETVREALIRISLNERGGMTAARSRRDIVEAEVKKGNEINVKQQRPV